MNGFEQVENSMLKPGYNKTSGNDLACKKGTYYIQLFSLG